MPTRISTNRSEHHSVVVEEEMPRVVAGLKGNAQSWKTFTLLDGRAFGIRPEEVTGIEEEAAQG